MPRQDNFPLSQPIFGEPVFNEQGDPTPDPGQFSTSHPSDDAIYKQIQDLLTKDVVSIPTSRGDNNSLFSLTSALGDRGNDAVTAIQQSGQISFHVIGDSGASKQAKYQDAISVADAVTTVIQSADPAQRQAFLFHVGDIVYDFCESQYWYDQFYEPYRNYPAPIFAIPGNHDSFIVPGTAPEDEPLNTFQSNFCATSPVVTQEAGSLHRTAGTQPGVYFALDAPFVRILGLFSNALEDPGVISSENGKWQTVPDIQLDFLRAQLQKVKDDNYAGALLIAVHHPPFSYSPPDSGSGGGGHHGGSAAMLLQIDSICNEVGVYPHAVLSGHAHNYQRYVRTITFNGAQYSIPFVISGNSGHNVNSLVSARGGSGPQEPDPNSDVSYLDNSSVFTNSKLVLQEYDDSNFGFNTVTATATQLTIAYTPVTGVNTGQTYSPIVINLATHQVV